MPFKLSAATVDALLKDIGSGLFRIEDWEKGPAEALERLDVALGSQEETNSVILELFALLSERNRIFFSVVDCKKENPRTGQLHILSLGTCEEVERDTVAGCCSISLPSGLEIDFFIRESSQWKSSVAIAREQSDS